MKRSETTRIRILVAAACFAYGLLTFLYRHLDHVARHADIPAVVPLVEQMTGVAAGLLLLLPFPAFVRRFPLRRGTWLRNAPAHVAAMIGFSVSHTWLMARSRELLFRLLDLGAYDYGDMRVRYWMEMANDTASYAILLMLVVGYGAIQHARAQDVAQAELRAELARAQVQSLEKRLHPHFLFNALNTISSVMYDDPAAADRMIAGLSDLLRRALRTSDAQEVPLAEELDLLERYLDIMRARFEDRLDVALDIDEGVRQAMVPPLLLQPLVENAIRHGADPASHKVRAVLLARREGQTLRLEVRDHGRGLAGSSPKQGVGLSTTARRLSTLYGRAQRLAFEDAAAGGLRVIVELPFRTTSAGTAG